MEGNRIEILITELTLLEPSLKEHEADLRAMLALIIAKRPDIRIDDAFRASLRERIFTTKPKAVVSPYTELSWWAVRLVPIGAVALLLITLVPGDILHAPTAPLEQSVMTTVEDAGTMDASESARVSQSDTMSVSEAPSFKTGGTGGGISDSDMADDSMKLSMEMATPDLYSLNLSGQPPGMSIVINSVTTQVPAFIVIRSYDAQGDETIDGISPLIKPGTTTSVPVYLRYPSHVGDYYSVTLVADNGNRVFTATEDLPLLTPGEIEIVSGYFE